MWANNAARNCLWRACAGDPAHRVRCVVAVVDIVGDWLLFPTFGRVSPAPCTVKETDSPLESAVTTMTPLRLRCPSFDAIIGLAGGIGSGKSNVLHELSVLGAICIDGDKLAHRVYTPGQPAFAQLVDAFGADIVGPSGTTECVAGAIPSFSVGDVSDAGFKLVAV